MLLGVLIGFVIGMLPGLGGPVAIAVMLPFTFAMSTPSAFAFLLGAISVLAMTGDITAILYGIPGDPGSAALTLDGHALAVKGEAGRAIGAMLASSVAGAVVGAAALAVSIPVLRPILLHFGSPEYFVLALLGLTFITSFGPGSLVKGLITGGLGLLLSMIGVNQASGIARYTFGQLALWEGIGLVPVAIGLFAIPAMLDIAGRGAIAGSAKRVGNLFDGAKDTLANASLTLRCSLIGTGVGLIPGLGGTVAQWLAYAHTTQTAKAPAQIGTGMIEGVIGPGAAQNSKEGSNLIAMAAFGIPTSVTMALLLGALNIKGLVPGIPMLTEHLEVTASFVWLILLSHLVAVAMTVLVIKQLLRITSVRANLLLPVLVSIAFLGALAERNSFVDIWLTLLFGAISVILNRLDWPIPPLILGLVLGALMERNLTIAVARYGGGWLARPLVVAILAITVASLLVPPLRARLRRLPAIVPRDVAPAQKIVRRNVPLEIAFTGLISIGSIAAVFGALNWPLEVRLFPLTIAAPLAALTLFQFLRCVRDARARATDTTAVKPPPQAGRRASIVTAASITGFAVIVSLVGFGIGAPIAALTYARFVGRERWLASAIVAACVATVMWGASKLLPVAIYHGFFWG